MANNHHAAWWVDLDTADNNPSTQAHIKLKTKSTRAVKVMNSQTGKVKNHMKHPDIKDPSVKLKYIYHLREPKLGDARFTACHFDPLAPMEFTPPTISSDGRTIEFYCLRKSTGTWKFLFQITDKDGKPYDPDPEITNENTEYMIKIIVWLCTLVILAGLLFWYFTRE